MNIGRDQILQHFHDEWLVANGIGGFACGTVGGTLKRKYHSLLIAALPVPFGRTNMLNYVAEEIIFGTNKESHYLSEVQHNEGDGSSLVEFKLKNGIPFWTYEINNIAIEKSLFLIHRQNTLSLSYKVLKAPDSLQINWRPYLNFRTNEQSVDARLPDESYTLHAKDFQYEIDCPNFPKLRIYNHSLPSFTVESRKFENIYYETEAKRGYPAKGNLSSPGYFSVSLKENERTTFLVSLEEWFTIHALTPEEAWGVERLRKKNILKMSGPLRKHSPITTQLVLAADQFLITPTTRYKDMIRQQAAGEEVKSILAGFPWFTDWGRDTMISLEGLTLTTGRYRDATTILHTFAHYVKEGLIPNMFPESSNQGIYNTADATLWFFHAIDRYIEITNDEEILEFLLPKLHEIIDFHLKGTKFGIKVDEDGLLMQGQKGFQLTWMDAKMGDWIVTPRRGKAVEINGLWFNALKLYESWAGRKLDVTQRCYESFNQKFWYGEGDYLYDVIEGEEGNDPALRPNQLFAISLRHPILQQEKWKNVLHRVKEDLLTPVGLRTLSPAHKDYKPRYDGDLQARDGAYHQGTVWPWLLGPYIDVWLKVYPKDFSTVRDLLKGLEDHLNADCLGTIGEIFDSSPPYHARGCFAQAWSVAEFLRCMAKVI